MLKRTLRLLVICTSFSLALAFVGCAPEDKEPVAVEVRVSTMEDLSPTKLTDRSAVLKQTGSEYQVDLQDKLEGTQYRITMNRHGEEFDYELYEVLPGGFGLVYAAGESFEPSIPLLRFPMDSGESWTWKGDAVADGLPAKASAKVTATHRQVYSCGVPVDSIETKVELTVEQAPPIKRTLSFTFAKGRGLYQRQFGATSTREPICR